MIREKINVIFLLFYRINLIPLNHMHIIHHGKKILIWNSEKKQNTSIKWILYNQHVIVDANETKSRLILL